MVIKRPAAHVSKPDTAEPQRLKDAALTCGLLAKVQRIATDDVAIGPFVRKLDGKDIVKKASTRKNRFMLVFNVLIAPAATGKLGTLAQLNTNHPVMYIDFPDGRLKLLGTLVFPKNKYMVLRPGNKDVVAEDVLESMIVFSECVWVGTAASNPTERPLPLPSHLAAQPPVHTNYSFEAGACMQAPGRQTQEPVIGSQALSALAVSSQPTHDGEASGEDVVRPSQRPRRAAAAQRHLYAEGSLKDGSGESLHSSDHVDTGDEEPAAQSIKSRNQGLHHASNGIKAGVAAESTGGPPGLTEANGMAAGGTMLSVQAAAGSCRKSVDRGKVKRKRKRADSSDDEERTDELHGDRAPTSSDEIIAVASTGGKLQQKRTPKPKDGTQKSTKGTATASGKKGKTSHAVADGLALTEAPSTSKRPSRAAGQIAAQRVRAMKQSVMELSSDDDQGANPGKMETSDVMQLSASGDETDDDGSDGYTGVD